MASTSIPNPAGSNIDPATAVNLPPEVQVKILNQKSDEWKLYHYAWELMSFAYVGGIEIESVAEQFLKRNPKEPSDVYQTRVEHFSYENHIGACIDFYLAALFEEPPSVEPAETDSDSSAPAGSENEEDPRALLSTDERNYFDGLEKNCDRAGTPILEHEREFLRNLLVYGRAASLIDLPKAGPTPFKNAQEEKASGQLDPYLVTIDPKQVINVGKNSVGALDWLIYTAREKEAKGPFDEHITVDRWYFFDRTQFAVYERIVPVDEKLIPDEAMATLVLNGPHCLADQNEVPIVFEEVPLGLWLMNRAFSSVKEHLNVDNRLSWSLKMAALAMPVVKMDGEFDLTLSEVGFIKLPLNSEYEWTEPPGRAWQALADRRSEVKEEIYRQCYLVAQSRSTKATPAAQSGYSKEQDMMASKKVMNLFGDLMRMVIQRVYDMLSAARAEDTTWDVRGLQFPEAPPDATLDMIATAMTLGVPSDNYNRELWKMAVAATLRDMNPKMRAAIFDEIAKAPTMDDLKQEALEQQGQQMASKFLLKNDFKGLGPSSGS